VTGATTSEFAPTGTPLGTPIAASQAELAAVKYDANGLVVAIVQEASSKDVLMVGWMDAEALRRTLATGRTWCWSRSRQEYWCKGETSGDRQFVHEVRYDCDADALLVIVDQQGGGACHTGEHSCFYRAFGRDDALSQGA
jgi:phosphoribosyl-AMP cyclohydrolase/phosphoribosyl-ATP pyrophosphohydrolase/phosphoribosyl-AMP cyclohydrolase